MDGLASSAHARPKAAHTHPARESEQQTELLLPWGATPKMKMDQLRSTRSGQLQPQPQPHPLPQSRSQPQPPRREPSAQQQQVTPGGRSQLLLKFITHAEMEVWHAELSRAFSATASLPLGPVGRLQDGTEIVSLFYGHDGLPAADYS